MLSKVDVSDIDTGIIHCSIELSSNDNVKVFDIIKKKIFKIEILDSNLFNHFEGGIINLDCWLSQSARSKAIVSNDDTIELKVTIDIKDKFLLGFIVNKEFNIL